MTLLSDIIMVLHDAEVPGYSVQAGRQGEPGDPDLVVVLDDECEERAADVLTSAPLPIASVRRAAPGVLHVWGVTAQRGPSPLS
jgi:hypothetical protein